MTQTPKFINEQLSDLAEIVDQNRNLEGGEGVLISDDAGGRRISFSPPLSPQTGDKRTVIITSIDNGSQLVQSEEGEPEPTDATLLPPSRAKVRGVRYSSGAPVAPGQTDEVKAILNDRGLSIGYRYDTAEFFAYPAIGHTIEEYRGFVRQADPDAELTTSETYFGATFVGNVWVLDRLPATSIQFVIVREVLDDQDSFVTVQDVFMKPPESPGVDGQGNPLPPVWSGLMKPLGEAYEVSVYPHFKAGDFRAFVTDEGQDPVLDSEGNPVFDSDGLLVIEDLTRKTSILHTQTSGGNTWLFQVPRFDLIQPDGSTSFGDCASSYVPGT